MSRFTPRSSADLTSEPPIPHLIHNVCRPSGSVLLYGRTGIGKSRLLWQMACAWSQGQSAFGLLPARPLRITFCEADMYRMDFESMIKEYASSGIVSSSSLCWFARDDETPMLVDGAFGTTLRDHNVAFNTDLTIYDAIPDMHLGDANDQRVAYQTLRALQTAANNRAYLGILVRRKGSALEASEEHETIDSMLGSQGWGRQASTVWQMTATPSLLWVKHRLCPQPPPIILTVNALGHFIPRHAGATVIILDEARHGFTSVNDLAKRVQARPDYAALPSIQQYKDRALRTLIGQLQAMGQLGGTPSPSTTGNTPPLPSAP